MHTTNTQDQDSVDRDDHASGSHALTFHEQTRRFQRRLIQNALEANRWNISKTDQQLGIARSHLYNLMGAHKLKRVRRSSSGTGQTPPLDQLEGR